MRKKAKYFLAALLMFCFATSANAEECSYERQVELKEEAATVKVSYDVVQIDTGEKVYDVDPETGEVDLNKEIPLVLDGFKIKIMNLTENLYVRIVEKGTDDNYDDPYEDEYAEVQSGVLKSAGYYFYDDSDNGTVYLEPIDADYVREYDVYVYSNDKDCEAKELRRFIYSTPMYNQFSALGYCNESPEFEYCQKYVTAPLNITIDEFMTEYKKYEAKEKEEKENKKQSKTIKEFYKKNKKKILIAGGCILIIGVTATAIIVIRRRSRLI